MASLFANQLRGAASARVQKDHASSSGSLLGQARSTSRSSATAVATSTLRPCAVRSTPFRGSASAHVSAIRSRRGAANVVCMAGNGEKLTIAVTGATGLVGSRLVAKLAAAGHKVRVLTRNTGAARSKLSYPGLEFFGPADWAKGVEGAYGVVNLAGEPIATRWTDDLKKAIKASRVGATTSVVNAIKAAPADKRPKVLVSASAVGYYGISQTATYSEDSPSGSDYLAEVCRAWEAAALEAQSVGVRVVIARIGIVLAPEGGALGKMLPVFQIFAGGPLGSGKQWMSWIHRDDLVDLITQSLTNPAFSGVYNATAPKPVRMSELCSALGNMLGRPSWLPVPEFALMTLLGEGASVVLEGQRVMPTRTQAAGYRFKYADIGDALRNLVRTN
ncbi:hypothetical protein CHLRE_05g233305v5 [Chlamydomonas reinhardtii]|uniref:Uncharacterized protein n=1 Tax=Chlamydomonas reinhardtii TaxID=3055 RepID=A0A2K3DRU9_CHLRE|nr:uncharacterized protein CHLRE_05g233305v5 [Chlamydomonas reinhardtii]PNW83260.1 hypothetical protein CHLRE_05g233305v5 [Chlamydomonas reinhardtii]